MYQDQSSQAPGAGRADHLVINERGEKHGFVTGGSQVAPGTQGGSDQGITSDVVTSSILS